MINIRLAQPKDVEQIKELCEKYSAIPIVGGFCLVAEEDGIILGMTNTIKIPTIDCFIASSPTIARRLYDSTMGALISNGETKVQFFTTKEDVKSLYKNMGFLSLGNNYTISIKEIK